MSDFIQEVFGPEGHLAQAFDGYKMRSGQVDLAQAVCDAISAGENLMVEGPAGTGKSFGYSVPAVEFAVRTEERVVIATANIALQEQLVKKDLPLLQGILPWHFEFALLKGRTNYLCRASLQEADQDEDYKRMDLDEREQFREIETWAKDTDHGDFSELGFNRTPRVVGLTSRSSDSCRGGACKFCKEGLCFPDLARSRARKADIVVVNYHLLFADMIVKAKTGKSIIIPNYEVLILDEAHKTADIARDFLGFRLSPYVVRRAVRLLGKISEQQLRDAAVTKAFEFFGELLEFSRSDEYSCRLREPPPVDPSDLVEMLRSAGAVMKKASMSSNTKFGTERKGLLLDLKKASARCYEIAGELDIVYSVGEEDEENLAIYLEEFGSKKSKTAVIQARVVDVAGLLNEMLFDEVSSSILTSATMTVEGRFDFVQGELGVADPRFLEVPTPFDFRHQAKLIVLEGMPAPTDRTFHQAVAGAVHRIIGAARGRTLALFTSYKSLNHAAVRLERDCDFMVLRQGDKPRTQLLQEFKDNTDSVLLGTESFWAGVDAPGETLSCVIIDRLPFASPEDPVLDVVKTYNDNWFWDIVIPRSIIQFKQGVGRLIRRVDDRGVIVILDKRMNTKSYGQAYYRSLPRMPVGESLDEIAEFLNGGA